VGKIIHKHNSKNKSKKILPVFLHNVMKTIRMLSQNLLHIDYLVLCSHHILYHENTLQIEKHNFIVQ